MLARRDGVRSFGDWKDGFLKLPIVMKDMLEHLSSLTSQDYTARMPVLLTIAYNGFKTMSNTLSAIQSCKSQILPVIHSDTFLLPPTLESSKNNTSKASESSGQSIVYLKNQL